MLNVPLKISSVQILFRFNHSPFTLSKHKMKKKKRKKEIFLAETFGSCSRIWSEFYKGFLEAEIKGLVWGSEKALWQDEEEKTARDRD